MADSETAAPSDASDWHAHPVDEVLARLRTGTGGLSAAEAQQRLAEVGPNALPTARPRSALRRLLLQFHNVLIYLLLVSSVAAYLLDHPVDAAVILAVVLINAVIGYVQEGKAERAMQAIGRMLAPRARALRDGRWQEIDAEALVPGDLIRLKAGDRVPADIRLLECHGLRVDQAALTGESVPVSKLTEAQPATTALADRSSMSYAGTLVTAGQGSGVVVATGRATELGRISTLLGEVHRLTTPLLRQMAVFGRWLALVVFGFAAATVALSGWLHGTALADGLMIGVALAVAAIPEGLPAIITITLAIGVQRMARRNAIIRRLPAVETLGAVSVICSDKTGTLTCNALVADRLGLAEGECPAGSPPQSARALLEAAALCNDASPHGDGDPLEVALIRLAEAGGVAVDALRDAHPRLALLPFSSEHKLMATRHRDRVCVKGAPEKLIARCDRQLRNGQAEAIDAEAWHRLLATMAGEGLRVLAVAERREPGTSAALDDADVADGLCLLGVVGFRDPPRPEVHAALDACRAAGIEVKMITGDHAATAAAIGDELGISGSGGVLTGPQIDALSPAELDARVGTVHVFARTTPEHKLRLVSALQASGRVVAMTGDGANDAPALKRADIGVAMGIKGTEASRQAAEMVLADDNFATIVNGVEEGRGVYENIQKSLLFILPTSVAEALVVLVAAVAGWQLPITPVQILWVNMVTAVTLGLALAFEPVEGDVMRRKPRPTGQGLITRYVGARIAWVAAMLTVGIFVLFDLAVAEGGGERLARSVALNALVAGELVYLFNCRRWRAPSWTLEALLANGWAWLSVAVLLALQFMLTYWPPAQQVFGTEGLALREWVWVAGLAIIVFAAVELEKAWLRGRASGQRGPA